jgi:hypothetical protein
LSPERIPPQLLVFKDNNNKGRVRKVSYFICYMLLEISSELLMEDLGKCYPLKGKKNSSELFRINTLSWPR